MVCEHFLMSDTISHWMCLLNDHGDIAHIEFKIFLNTSIQRSVYFVRDTSHDDVIKWKYFPRYWPFVRGIHRSSHTKASDDELWCSLSSAPEQTVWVNNRDAGDLRRNRAHYNCNILLRSPMPCKLLYLMCIGHSDWCLYYESICFFISWLYI